MAFICLRKESVWERREAAACVGRGQGDREGQRKGRRNNTMQIGCFNCRVVTLVAWFSLVIEGSFIKHLER